ncbi:hypothetical protein BHE74_00021346 [Ensete ventricosum]|nr:hypothetical protein BHE74_00021346 [Ensete ventricosum]
MTSSIQTSSSTHFQSKKLQEKNFAIDRQRAYVGICDEPWSRDHRFKKGRLLMIEPIQESKEEDPEPEQKDTKKDPQPVISTVYALVGHTNPQTMKIEGFLEQQPVIVLIDIGSTNNFMNNKVVV